MRRETALVHIAGHEYRVRGDADEAWLQQVASHVDETMQQVRERTGTIDTYEIAVLAALNIARELMLLRKTVAATGGGGTERLRSLIELAESAVELPEVLDAGPQ